MGGALSAAARFLNWWRRLVMVVVVAVGGRWRWEGAGHGRVGECAEPCGRVGFGAKPSPRRAAPGAGSVGRKKAQGRLRGSVRPRRKGGPAHWHLPARELWSSWRRHPAFWLCLPCASRGELLTGSFGDISSFKACSRVQVSCNFQAFPER